jgi:ABC-type Fe2+-enterobactin transport system substrate-binding protein
MSDQDNDFITTAPDVEANEGPSREWLSVHRTTAAEQESARWVEGRNHDVVTNRAIKQALGHDSAGYRAQLEALSSGERLELTDKTGEEIVAHLDERAAAERDQKEREDTFQKQAKEQADNFAGETQQLREVRKAMKTA